MAGHWWTAERLGHYVASLERDEKYIQRELTRLRDDLVRVQQELPVQRARRDAALGIPTSTAGREWWERQVREEAQVRARVARAELAERAAARSRSRSPRR